MSSLTEFTKKSRPGYFLAACIGLGLLLSSVVSANTAGVDPLRSLLTEYEASTGVPVTGLDRQQLEKLAEGTPVYRTVRITADGASGNTVLRIVGYRLIDEQREPLWLAALAFDGNYSSRLTEHLIQTLPRGDAIWYQHVNMPWPLKNRHWVIRTSKNVALATATDGRFWEHSWSLHEDGAAKIAELASTNVIDRLSGKQITESILLPSNNGAWVMARVADRRTLVVLHATMDMGGVIPDALVARSTRNQLRRMLMKIEGDSAVAYENYSADYPIYRGDGTMIPVPRDSTAESTDDQRDN